MYVCGYNRDFYDGNDTHETDNAQESEDVIIPALILPHASKNEQQLDEDDGKRDKPRQKNAVDTLSVPRLCRDLARYAVGFRRVLVRLTAMIAIPTSDIYERELNE